MKKMILPKQLVIYCDGGSRGNPGNAAYGFAAYDGKNNKIFEGSQFLGIATNNQAEYKGVLGALEYIDSRVENNIKESVEMINFYLDSKLIVEQMNGNYKIKNEGLKPLYWQIREYISKIDSEVKFNYIPREKNKYADKLVNIELDRVANK